MKNIVQLWENTAESPYQKQGFTVTGLPGGLPFRKPSRYGHKQLNLIMKHADSIVFIIDKDTPLPQDVPMAHVNTADETRVESGRCPYLLALLPKVCGTEVAQRVLHQNNKVQEEDVEVEDLTLNKFEYLRLHTTSCKNLFESDAWFAAGANIRHHDKKGLVLPIYTNSDEQFWLFFSPTARPSCLLKTDMKHRIWGVWMDISNQEGEVIYDILPDSRQFIHLESVIRSEIGPIYLYEDISVKEGESYTPPDILVECVLDCLGRTGFLKE